jgi:hypothetical protein
MKIIFSRFSAMVFSICFSSIASATIVSTQIGKIVQTQGHISPPCRTVQHKETATGIVRSFRLTDVAGGHDDISSTALAALVANRDVVVSYDPAVTSGCGGESAIQYISIY